MNSLNKVQLIGNLTADPEVRQTPNGQNVASVSIATNRQWKDGSGEKQEQVEFHNVVLWGKLAEITEQYVKKGQKVYIEGRLQTRSWDDPSGTKRYKTEVVGENLIMLGGKTSSYENDSNFDSEPSEMSAPKVKKTKPKGEEEIRIEDIPF